MNAPLHSQDWLTANQQALSRSFEALRSRLQDRAGEIEPEAIPALARLAALFGLSRFETKILLLCAAHELDDAVPALCAQARGRESPPYPTFGLALALFADGHWSALCPGAPLRHWFLIELDAQDGIATGRLRISEAVLHYLVGIVELDERLTGVLRPVVAPDLLAPHCEAMIAELAEQWCERRAANGALAPLELIGDDAPELEAAAAELCARAGVRLLALPARELPQSAEALSALLRRLQRDLVLADACLLVDAGTETVPSLPTIVDRIDRGPIMIAPSPTRNWSQRRPRTVTWPKSKSSDRARLWQTATAGLSLPASALTRAMGQFHLKPSGLRSVVARLGDGYIAEHDTAGAAEQLWQACRLEAAASLTGLAQLIEARATWEDLVLPAPQTMLLRALLAQLRQRATVYDAWGFGAQSSRGLGISALFAGPTGTGKTMAAEVIASALDLDLWRIDLSQVVSKWLGETEKNLARVFEAADPGGAVLLFDEADAIFGKRSEVRDSHDRYANLEVSFLLQRMESYRGLAILTTNNEDALDDAFMRRLRTVVHFPFPDATLRARIWQRIFPAQTPAEGLRPDKLARLQISGGTIRNIALTAAFLAAEAALPVRMEHLKAAAEIEGVKMKRPVRPEETEDWLNP